MDGAQVGVLKETNQVSLTSLLQSSNSSTLEPEVSLEILGYLPHLEKNDIKMNKSDQLTNLWKGSFLMRSSVDFWYLLISLRATVPGLRTTR